MDLGDASTYFCVGPAVISIRIYYFSSECYHSFGRFKGTFSISRREIIYKVILQRSLLPSEPGFGFFFLILSALTREPNDSCIR